MRKIKYKKLLVNFVIACIVILLYAKVIHPLMSGLPVYAENAIVFEVLICGLAIGLLCGWTSKYTD